MVEERATELVQRQLEDVEDRATKRTRLDNEPPEMNSELKDKITKQIAYYFSDVNLVKDKFLQEQLKKNDHCVKLSVLLTFARLAQLTKDEDVLIQALKDVQSDVLEVDEVKKLIKRKTPLPNPEEYQKELDTRTIHISGFPDFIKFDDLLRFCSRFGEVESLSMRQHYKTKQFKGCIHVVYKDIADVQKILEGPDLLFKDRELRRESMGDYHQRKERIKKHRTEMRKLKRKNKGDESQSGDEEPTADVQKNDIKIEVEEKKGGEEVETGHVIKSES